MLTTAAQLIDELRKAAPDTAIMTREPPFTGVKIVPQGDGKILIAPPDSGSGKNSARSGQTASGL